MRHQRRDSNREHVRRMRQGPTDAERVMWRLLRDRRLERVKFRRQHRLGDLIVDFYCPRLRLAIELDGRRHFTESGEIADRSRSEELGAIGVTVVRFENLLLMSDPAWVTEQIGLVIDALRSSPSRRLPRISYRAGGINPWRP